MSTANGEEILTAYDRQQNLVAATLAEVARNDPGGKVDWVSVFEQLKDYLQHETWQLQLRTILDLPCFGSQLASRYISQDKPKMFGHLSKNTKGIFFSGRAIGGSYEEEPIIWGEVWGITKDGWISARIGFAKNEGSYKALVVENEFISSAELLAEEQIHPLLRIAALIKAINDCHETCKWRLERAEERALTMSHLQSILETRFGPLYSWEEKLAHGSI
jgi:hypothetical protein